MKTKSWLWLAGAAFILLTARQVEATGACTAARFHDWHDAGCNQNYAGAGGASSGQSGAGGNQAQCQGCHTNGMPRWWVSEPYENLWMSDTPLDYQTSSGQEMAFKFYYHQRYKLPEVDEVPDYYLIGAIPRASYDPYISGVRTYGMTNASWGNDWTMNVMFWDSQWENGDGVYQGFHPVYSDSYEAFMFRPEGDVEYFYKTNGQSSLQDPRSQVQLQPLSATNYPVVSLPSPDTNGIYWGSSTNGFRLVYPDGSQDIFGLTYYDVPASGSPYRPNTFVQGNTTAEALLTRRIDPQGRVTQVGYEAVASLAAYRVRYVVDPDGRTNAFLYATNNGVYINPPPLNPWQLSEVDDPYGRKVQLGYDFVSGVLTGITDAAGNTSSFQYLSPLVTNQYVFTAINTNCSGGHCPTNIIGLSTTNNGGWITNLTTPYGNTSFSFYQVPDATVTNGFQQRAVYVGEPEGAQQFFVYEHTNSLIPTTGTSPTNITGQSFDNGTSGSTHYLLNYRNTFHWGRRQFAALSSSVQSDLPGSLSNAIASLTLADYNKAGLKHWLLSSNDMVSITEAMSSEQDPSPDAAGSIAGLRTWYAYVSESAGSPEQLGGDPQVSCIARVLPDGSSQYTTYHFYPSYYLYGGAGLVSDNESSYSKPDGTVGALTNWFTYASNSVDLLSVSNSAGQFVEYGYSTNHAITSITNALNQVTTLTWQDYAPYDLATVQFSDGRSLTLNYYPPVIGRYAFTNATTDLLKQISVQPEGRVFNIVPTNGLPGIVTDDRGLSWTNTWDGLNRLTGTLFPDNTTVSNVYDRLDVGATKDRLDHWTYYVHDGLQHLTSVTNANQAVTSYSWCGCGSLTSIIDALTHTTTLNYDNQGNLTNITFPDYSSLTYQFDLAGRMTNVFDGAGRSLHLAYNNQGLVTNVTGAYGTLRSVVYDAVNRPIYMTDANGITVTNQYDALNELLKRTWPDGISEGFGYSTNGLIAYTNRDQQATYLVRDGAERIVTVTNANHEVIRLGYDSLDDVTNLVDGLNHTTTWQYNQYGWLTNKVDGLNRNAFQFAYNANGWVTNRSTPAKGNTGYTFDNVGNLTSISYLLSSISYSYNLLNELTNMVDASGTNAFTYTTAGQLASESNAWAKVSYTYAQGLRTAMSIGSWSQSYSFDSAWRLTDIVSPAGAFSYVFGGTSAASSLIKTISLPNGASITNGYDALARLTQTSLNNYWGHTLDGYAYIPDPLGLRTNIVRNLGLTSSSVSVGYDSIGQIISWAAKETNGTARLNEQLGFGFDAADNLHSRTNNLLVQTFNVDAANELTNVSRSGTLTLSGATPAPATNVTVNGSVAQTYGDFTFARTNLTLLNGNNTFTNITQNIYGFATTNTFTVNLPTNVSLSFDSNGSLTNDGTRTFEYDSENQLTNVAIAGQWQSSFVYDGLNRRKIERDYSWNGSGWTPTNEVHFIYDGYLLVQERDTNNNVLVTYTRGLDFSGSLNGAGGSGGLLARTDANGSTYYHADGAGNITALMDGNENIVARYLYGPFGKLIGKWGSMADANEMGFSSMPTHDGIVFYPFRAYDPIPQRWLTEDPIQEWGGINLYRAMNGNPLRYIDPLGLQEVEPERPDIVVQPQPVIYPRGTMPVEELDKELDELKNSPMPSDAQIGPAPSSAKGAPMTEDDWAKAMQKMGDQYADFQNQNSKTCPDKTPFVIGQNMKDRVIPFANKYGFDYYQPGPSLGSETADLAANKAAIQNVINAGNPIIDIGPDPANPTPSVYYNMESQLVSENSVPVVSFYGFQIK